MLLRLEKDIKVNLILTEEEALWLRDVMQNPLNNLTPDQEPEEDANMRKRFWQALYDINI